jgi:hypothetical protein
MGWNFGRNTGNRSYTYSDELAKKIKKKGGGNSTGASHLLRIMSGAEGGDPQSLCAEEAEQAAQSLQQAAQRLRGDDRRIAESIARDAQDAADAGRPWTIG